MSVLKKVIEIAEMSGSNTIEVWTNSFKARGTLLSDKDKVEKGIVTLTDVVVSSLMHECDEECGCIDRKMQWLNIFEDHLIGFTVIKK